MAKKAIVRNLSTTKAPLLISFAHTIATKLDSNPNFPSPAVPPQELETSADTLIISKLP